MKHSKKIKGLPRIYDDETRIYDQTFVGWTIKETCLIRDKVYDDGSVGKDSMEGGLTFILERNGKTKMVTLGYTELGEWIEYEVEL